MAEIIEQTLAYFRSPKQYFWRWADKGDVIEWKNGATICYREELMLILKGLCVYGVPPMGTLLLTLAACQDNWKEASGGMEILQALLKEMHEEETDPSNEYLEYYIQQAIRFMDVVNDLPRELRTGARKIHLLQEVYSGLGQAISASEARNVVDEFGSGRLDELILTGGEEVSRTQFYADLEPLNKALQQFNTKETLELRLRTGLTKLPEPVEMELPEPDQAMDLLDQLAEDPKTVGISRLTQRLVAAINIPMHSKGSSDQPIGGVSDITNRGNFDRLLLSELAYDDDLLMARLVNNEALYLRREEPPAHLDRQRTILVDSTIKMWGMPRTFAVSAALACSYNRKHIKDVKAYTLGSKHFQEIDLTTKKGVINSLEVLDAGLDCYKALASFMQDKAKVTQTDFIMVTDARAVTNSEFMLALAELKQPLTFLITVNRRGEMSFYEFMNGKCKHLSSTKFDLEELLFAPSKRKAHMAVCKGELPAFMAYNQSPLLFPATGMTISDKRLYFLKDKGAIGITETQRVLCWWKQGLGAREMLDFIEEGDYYFGSDGVSAFYILLRNSAKKLLKFFTISVEDGEVKIIDFNEEIPNAQDVVFESFIFYIKEGNKVNLLDCRRTRVTEVKDYLSVSNLFKEKESSFRFVGAGYVKRFINNGYSVLNRINQIGINEFGELSLDNRPLRLLQKNGLRLVYDSHAVAKSKLTVGEAEILYMMENTRVVFRKFTWADGSEAVIDSRGFLHLKSSDKNIPEFTLVLILNKPTACWAADGVVCGSEYFILSNEEHKRIDATEFHKRYIQRFIDGLS